MGKSVYTNAFKSQVVEFYKTHTAKETAEKFSLQTDTVEWFGRRMGFAKGNDKYPLDFKHEACQYYDNHTGDETCEKFGITIAALCTWRKTLGYRNKSRGYNLYTQEYRQQSRAPLHFKSVRGEDGKYTVELLQKRITDLEAQIATMQPDVELAQSIRNLFN